MIDFTAFHEEIEKIAQEKEEKKGRWITKGTLKRLAIAAPVAAAGAGLGHGVGKLVGRYALSDTARRAMQEMAKKHPIGSSIGRKLPAIAGGLAAGAGVLQALKNKKMLEYVEGKDEGKRPQ